MKNKNRANSKLRSDYHLISSSAVLHNIYTRSTRQNPPKNPKQNTTARKFLHLPPIPDQTLPLPIPTLNASSPLSLAYLLLHSPQTPPRFLRHRFLPREFVAPQVHLPARHSIGHQNSPPRSRTRRFGDLRVRIRPTVEVDVRAPRRTAGVADAVARRAEGAHFSEAFSPIVNGGERSGESGALAED